jgi:hypothetical protein
MTTFVELVLTNKMSLKHIDDFIDLWHSHPVSGVGLIEALGFTEQEYAEWIICDSTLESIIARHKMEVINL